MSNIQIQVVETPRQMRQFIDFKLQLYKDCPYAVPELALDIENTFNPRKNAVYAYCETRLFLAYRDNKVVGRIAGIINKRANDTWHTKNVRFGWIDFIEDIEVARALLNAVEDWGSQNGLAHIQGPLGMTDLDPSGMLLEDFDKMATMFGIYNYAYYPRFMEQLGFVKEKDWVSARMNVPASVPDKFARVSQMCKDRYKLRVLQINSSKEIIKKGYGKQMFQLINESYTPLFGYTKVDEQGIDQYVNNYLPILDPRMLCGIVNEKDQIVGVGVSMPSIVQALRKAKGRLLPFGWWHLLKAMKWKYEGGVELLLIGVHPDYQNKGVNGIIFDHLIRVYQQMGFEWAETDHMLEDNVKVLAQWEYLSPRMLKRCRCFTKEITR